MNRYPRSTAPQNVRHPPLRMNDDSDQAQRPRPRDWHRGWRRHPEPPAREFHHLIDAIHAMGYQLMLAGARVTGNTTTEIINDTGKMLTINFPGGLLRVHLIVDARGRRNWCECWPGTRRKQERQNSGPKIPRSPRKTPAGHRSSCPVSAPGGQSDPHHQWRRARRVGPPQWGHERTDSFAVLSRWLSWSVRLS